MFLHQEWDYPAPAYIGDTVTAEAEVVEARADKPITTLRCVARRADGTEVLRGDVRRLHDPSDRARRDPADEAPAAAVAAAGDRSALGPMVAGDVAVVHVPAPWRPLLAAEWNAGRWSCRS